MAYLALVRHGQSTWNAIDAWTGLTDISINEEWLKQAREDGQILKDMTFQIAFTSSLRRAQQTLDEILKVLDITHIPIYQSAALNERDYGDFTGKNKFELEKVYGTNQFLKWRRGWNEPIPHGETLKNVFDRVIPYYQDQILPKLIAGKNVIVSAHGNSLRALIKYLERISDEDIPNLELETGEIYIYGINKEGQITSKDIRSAN